MAVKVGINGFGRIGRNVVRASLGNPTSNSWRSTISPRPKPWRICSSTIPCSALHHEITADDDSIAVDGKKIKVFAERIPRSSTGLPWAPRSWSSPPASSPMPTKARHLQGTVKKVIIRLPRRTKTSPSSWA